MTSTGVFLEVHETAILSLVLRILIRCTVDAHLCAGDASGGSSDRIIQILSLVLLIIHVNLLLASLVLLRHELTCIVLRKQILSHVLHSLLIL